MIPKQPPPPRHDDIAAVRNWLGYFYANASPVKVPVTAGAKGTAGQWAHDSSYIYVCVAPDTWKRAALSSW